MPVYQVEVTVTKTMNDTIIVQADDEQEARNAASDIAGDTWEPDTTDTTIDSISQLSADEVLEKAGSVVSA